VSEEYGYLEERKIRRDLQSTDENMPRSSDSDRKKVGIGEKIPDVKGRECEAFAPLTLLSDIAGESRLNGHQHNFAGLISREYDLTDRRSGT
jgi:hypothetical protein